RPRSILFIASSHFNGLIFPIHFQRNRYAVILIFYLIIIHFAAECSIGCSGSCGLEEDNYAVLCLETDRYRVAADLAVLNVALGPGRQVQNHRDPLAAVGTVEMFRSGCETAQNAPSQLAF